VPQETVYGDVVALAGAEGLTQKAQAYLAEDKPLEALHLVDMVLEIEDGNQLALMTRKAALQNLLAAAKSGDNNSYEIYWLNYRLRDADDKILK